METSPAINSITLVNHQWVLCTFASFLGCIMVTLCLKLQYHDVFRQSAFGSNIGSVTTAVTLFENFTSNVQYTDQKLHVPGQEFSELFNEAKDDLLRVNEPKKKCDIFDGRWVYDPKGSPLYEASQCPFLSDQVSCQKNGRPDSDYERWRWEARDCEIPRLNGKVMLERLRGKRVVIVGDSLNRNQWESLACLLYSAIPSRRAYIDVGNGLHKVFKAKDYNCSVEFYWSPFLVQLNDKQAQNGRILVLDHLSASAQQWRGADIMVFNTGHWWVHRGKMQAWDFFQHEGMLVEEMEVETAFKLAMKAWAHWIDLHADPAKTTIFFRSISPAHKGQQWCFNETQPIKGEPHITSFRRTMIDIVESTIEEMKTPVKYLNITKLSQYRKDAHPTVYTTKQGKLLTNEQREQPKLYADCNHWCLPGLPDTWNLLMFTSIALDLSQEA